ncbi:MULTISPECIES: hypothetical protein [Priestia]|uniref:hypothetical protein n=1 Tax=Priestia TaxID=2800373 RepID=UPI000B1E75DB|nr:MULTISPECIES: hypothetical protein [Priestia]MCE4093138.1 hypothetical protein [Priestia megaterium]MED3821827.1 hypothetical protein [Priestia aryabhattai]
MFEKRWDPITISNSEAINLPQGFTKEVEVPEGFSREITYEDRLEGIDEMTTER